MIDTEDMLYWIFGFIMVLVILDFFLLRPYQDRSSTDRLIRKLRYTDKDFYAKLRYTEERGIVIPVNEQSEILAILLINNIKRLNCQLPILVTFIDTLNNEALFTKLGVAILDIRKHLSVENPGNNYLRVYSLIYSPFQQVLLLAPDLIFIQNPATLFQDPGYQHTGMLCWKDTPSKGHLDKRVWDWVRLLIPYRKDDNRILDKKSGNYQSDSMLLIHKPTHLKTLENLYVLSNAWKVVYNYLPSDKETFWIAAELAKEPYAFVPSYPGAIGEVNMYMICGHVLFRDTIGNVLCWNGSLFKNSRQTTDFTHYCFDRDWTAFQNNKCLRVEDPMPVDQNTKQLINEYILFLHDLRQQLHG